MPTEQLKALAKKHNVSLATAERLWSKAKKSAKKAGKADDYEYIVGVLKIMIANHKKGKK